MSFAGSAQRLWPLTRRPQATWARVLTITGMVLLINVIWSLVLCWYMMWGALLVPYRLVRRGQRKRKLEQARHEELLQAQGWRPQP
jgi:hypothetical protein